MIHLGGRTTKMSRTLFLFSALALLLSIMFIGPAAAINDDAWADDMADWGYRVPITITDAPTAANVQREINLTYLENMQTDFDDIRFRTSTGSSIDYWIEEKTDSSYANVWVELPSASMTYIYAYYGNTEAASVSNPDAVFLFYDTFDDLTKWTATSGTWTATSGEAYQSLTGPNRGVIYASGYPISSSAEIIIESEGQFISGSVYGCIMMSGRTTSDDVTFLYTGWRYESSIKKYFCIGVINSAFPHSWSTGTYYTNQVIYSDGKYSSYIDGIAVIEGATHSIGISTYPALRTWDAQVKVKYYLIRAYDAAATSFSTGDVEEQNMDVIPYPGYSTPTDPDTDGLYEDVNGNSRLDFQDIMIFFQYNAWAQANQPNVSCFDWSGNGAIEFSDVQEFWESEFT